MELTCHIGVPDEERNTPQRLLADIELYPANPMTGLADEIDHTVDYDRLARGIERIAAAKPRKLIETLAEDIAAWLETAQW